MDIPPSRYLFGDYLAKRPRDIKETSKINQAFTTACGGKFHRQNNTGIIGVIFWEKANQITEKGNIQTSQNNTENLNTETSSFETFRK